MRCLGVAAREGERKCGLFDCSRRFYFTVRERDVGYGRSLPSCESLGGKKYCAARMSFEDCFIVRVEVQWVSVLL